MIIMIGMWLESSPNCKDPMLLLLVESSKGSSFLLITTVNRVGGVLERTASSSTDLH